MSGSFTFKWAYPAGEVYVTGTFDDWKKSTKLQKEGEAFVAKVELPVAKTLYKFVVDGNWVIDQSARREYEGGIENNLLTPEDIVAEQPETEMSAATISSAAPESTTAALAAAVPLENTTVHDSTISSAAPESSTAELAGAVHTPGPADVPGGFIVTPADTPTAESADPIIAEKKEEKQDFSAKALPASDSPTNPFTLAPGEPVPVNEFTTQNINKHVRFDAESYEKADASNLGFSPSGAPVLSDVVTPAAQREAEGRGVLDIPVVTTDIIPESSLPATCFAVATAAPEVPEIVKESQEEAKVEPEASAIPEVVEQKKEVEEELKAEVSVAQKTGTVEAESRTSVAGIACACGESNHETTPAVVPEIVRESQEEAHVGPEASAVEAAVEAKKEYEQELQKEVQEIVRKPQDAPSVPGTFEQEDGFEEVTREEARPTEVTVLNLPTAPNGVAPNGNATETKSGKEAEANGTGFKSSKKSLENGDDRGLKGVKRRGGFISYLKGILHLGTGTKEKGKAKGETSP